MPRKEQFKEFCKRGHKLSETRYHDGRRYRCRACGVEDINRWSAANPTRRKELRDARTYDERRTEYLKRVWKLAPEEIGKVCHGCGVITNSLHVDHDHATGRVRGFLCRQCNTGIGMLKDDPALLRSMAEYLEVQSCPQV